MSASIEELHSSLPNEGATEHEIGGLVRLLGADVNSGSLQLPSFPEVALRVQRVLSNDDVNIDDVVRVIAAEPALALRIMQIANSAALNPGGRQVTELRTAVNRLGFNLVRGAAVVFIVEQLRAAENLRSVKRELHVLWERSVTVAALGFVIARRFTQVNPDTALLTGLLHAVGKIYILARAADHPAVRADQAAYGRIERNWHAGIARTLLDGWQVPYEIVHAVQEYEDLDREGRGPITLTEVLCVAEMLATLLDEDPSEEVAAELDAREMRLDSIRIWGRLRIDRQGCEAAVEESAKEIAALRAILR